jgi:hypothetical protein
MRVKVCDKGPGLAFLRPAKGPCLPWTASALTTTTVALRLAALPPPPSASAPSLRAIEPPQQHLPPNRQLYSQSLTHTPSLSRSLSLSLVLVIPLPPFTSTTLESTKQTSSSSLTRPPSPPTTSTLAITPSPPTRTLRTRHSPSSSLLDPHPIHPTAGKARSSSDHLTPAHPTNPQSTHTHSLPTPLFHPPILSPMSKVGVFPPPSPLSIWRAARPSCDEPR